MRDKERFPNWLEHEPDADDLEKVWAALDEADLRSEVPVDTDAAWTALSARLGFGASGEEGPAEASPAAPKRDRVPDSGTFAGRGWLRAAAAVLFLLGGATVWQSVPVSHVAAPGERLAVVLPDGSGVTLNAGSTLRHRRGFQILPGLPQGERSVRLEGEAFFEVSTNGRPFEVQAGTARVTVLGTRFNVRARSLDAEDPVWVDVEEGRVRVEAASSRAATELGAGEAVRVAPGAETLAPVRVAVDRIAPWRNGGLTVVDEPLVNVVREIGLRFGVDVALADRVDGSVRVTAFYPLMTGVESVLSDLATQQSLRVRRTAAGWELF